MIKHVIFDLDGVIRGIKNTPISEILPRRLKAKYSKQFQGVGLLAFIAKYLPMNVFKEWDKGHVKTKDVIEEVIKVADEPAEVVENALNAALKKEHNFIYQDTINLIKKLKQEGFKTYILSNMCVEVVELMSQMFDFEMFDGIIFSGDVGMRKPDIEIYQYTLDKWGIDPKESIFVDDSAKNLEPFTVLGGHTFHFDNKNLNQSLATLYEVVNKTEASI